MVDGGSLASINCTVDGGDGRISIAWLKDGQPLMEGGQVQFIGDSTGLILSSVSKHDRGMYQCLARSGDETAQASAELVLEGNLIFINT